MCYSRSSSIEEIVIDNIFFHSFCEICYGYSTWILIFPDDFFLVVDICFCDITFKSFFFIAPCILCAYYLFDSWNHWMSLQFSPCLLFISMLRVRGTLHIECFVLWKIVLDPLMRYMAQLLSITLRIYSTWTITTFEKLSDRNYSKYLEQCVLVLMLCSFLLVYVC